MGIWYVQRRISATVGSLAAVRTPMKDCFGLP
jgi:hypothetical protein